VGMFALRRPRALKEYVSWECERVEGRRTNRTASEFVGLAVVGLVIGSVAITQHSHDIRKHNTRSVILVRIEKDTQTLEFVLVAKHGTLLCSVGGHPHGEPITEKVALAIDVEFNLNLPVRGGQRHARVDPAGLRRAVGAEADVLVGADDGVAAKVPPSALEV
jgi:hypothetical protein